MNADSQMMDLYIPKPVSVDMHYDRCSSFAHCNRRRRGDLKLEKKLGTKIRDKCVYMSIFGVSVVDTYNVATKYLTYEETSNVFFCDFSEETIHDNMG